jgi:acid phosphatase class B
MFKQTIRKWVLVLISFFKSTKEAQTPQKADDPRHCAEDLRSNWEYNRSRGQRAVPWDKRHLVNITIRRGDVMHYCIVCDNPMVDLTKKVLLQEDIQKVIHPLPVQSEFGPEGHLVWAHWTCMHFYKEGLKSPWSIEMNMKLQVSLDIHNAVRFEDQAFKKAQSEIQRRLRDYGIHGINVSITEINEISAQKLAKKGE